MLEKEARGLWYLFSSFPDLGVAGISRDLPEPPGGLCTRRMVEDHFIKKSHLTHLKFFSSQQYNRPINAK